MSRLNTFIPPKPSRAVISLMTPVNRWLNLYGIPLLRDIPLLNCLPLIRGLCDIRCIDLPAADAQRLQALLQPENAVILTPNHPEYFIDWMLDKEIEARFSPYAANWATHAAVNGMGKTMQRFWLANNLIAQIPKNSEPALAHSVQCLIAGTPVLLHPEGRVAWLRDQLMPLYGGAANIAQRAAAASEKPVYIQPLIWKMQFLRDEMPALLREIRLIEKQLRIRQPPKDFAARFINLHTAALVRQYQRCGIDYPTGLNYPQAVQHLQQVLAGQTGAPDADSALRQLRSLPALSPEQRRIYRTLQTLKSNVLLRYECRQWRQEHIAEALKRLRCSELPKNFQNTLHQFVPRPVGGRIAHIRALEAIDCRAVPAEDITVQLQQAMQRALDVLEQETAGGYQAPAVTIDFHAAGSRPDGA